MGLKTVYAGALYGIDPLEPTYNLVSGSASKLSSVGDGDGMQFGRSAPGYMRLVTYRDGKQAQSRIPGENQRGRLRTSEFEWQTSRGSIDSAAVLSMPDDVLAWYDEPIEVRARVIARPEMFGQADLRPRFDCGGNPGRVPQAKRLQPGLNQALSQVVHRRVTGCRYQHALLTFQCLSHHFNQRVGLARAWRTVDQRDVLSSHREADRGLLAFIERLVAEFHFRLLPIKFGCFKAVQHVRAAPQVFLVGPVLADALSRIGPHHGLVDVQVSARVIGQRCQQPTIALRADRIAAHRDPRRAKRIYKLAERLGDQ